MSQGESPKNRINLNLVQVLDLGCGIMNQMFLRQTEEKGKPVFKRIKSGEKLSLGELTLTPQSEQGEALGEKKIPLFLELDYSEFCGPGFNFRTFRVALKAMIERIATRVRAKKDLNLLTNQQTGGVLVHQPGVIQSGEQVNVLLLAIEPAKGDGLIFKLMFVDPDQYRRDEKTPAPEMVVEADSPQA